MVWQAVVLAIVAWLASGAELLAAPCPGTPDVQSGAVVSNAPDAKSGCPSPGGGSTGAPIDLRPPADVPATGSEPAPADAPTTKLPETAPPALPVPPAPLPSALPAPAAPLPATAPQPAAAPVPTEPLLATGPQPAAEPQPEPAPPPPTDARAEERCVDPATLGIPRITADLPRFQASGVCVLDRRISENGLDWRILVIGDRGRPGPLWVVPHNNEWVAFRTASYAMTKFGGTIVAVETGGSRYFGKLLNFFRGQDPNREFVTTAAAARSCREAQFKAAPKFTEGMLREWDRSFPIIALHSNLKGLEGSISAKNRNAKDRPFPATTKNDLTNDDTMVYVARTVPPSSSGPDRELISWFNGQGVNIMYEYVTPANNDCSLSNYVALNRVGNYFNVEVPRSDSPASNNPTPPDESDGIQIKIVKLLMQYRPEHAEPKAAASNTKAREPAAPPPSAQ